MLKNFLKLTLATAVITAMTACSSSAPEVKNESVSDDDASDFVVLSEAVPDAILECDLLL